MATSFKQVKNNAQSLVATAPSPATSGTSLVVTAADGTKFPAPGNGFWATIWNSTTYAEPGLDANREIVLVTARSTDTFTITRAQQSTAARTVVVGDAIRLLWTAQHNDDFVTAINAIENALPKFDFECTVAASGGDYTTVAAALAAGKRSIFVKSGTYTEGTLSTSWSGTKGIYIVGEDRETTILQLASSTTGYFNLSLAGSFMSNITVKPGSSNLDQATRGWINIAAANTFLDNVKCVGTNSASYTTGYDYYTDQVNSRARNCRFETSAAGGNVRIGDGATLFDFSNCYFSTNQAGQMIYATGSAATDGRIKGCYFTSTSAAGSVYGISMNAGGGSDYSRLRVTGNDFFLSPSAGFYGIGCAVYHASGVESGFIFAGNNAYLSGRGASILDTGSGITGAVVANNTAVRNSDATANQTYVIRTQGADAVITGNRIVSIGTNVTNLRGITSTAANATITGNSVTGCLGTTNVGIYNTGASVIISGNSSYNNTANYSVSGTIATSYNFSNLEVAGQLYSRQYTQTFSATPTFDFNNGSVQYMALTANVTATTFSNPNGGAIYTIILKQDATGTRTVAWPASVLWPSGVAPTLSVAANKTDVLTFVYDSTNSKYLGSSQLTY